VVAPSIVVIFNLILERNVLRQRREENTAVKEDFGDLPSAKTNRKKVNIFGMGLLLFCDQRMESISCHSGSILALRREVRL